DAVVMGQQLRGGGIGGRRVCRCNGNGDIPVYRYQNGGLSCGYYNVFAGHMQLSGCGHPKWARHQATSTEAPTGPGRTGVTWPKVATRCPTYAALSGRQMITTFGPASAVA